jgi:hypothetical protein
MSPCMIFSPFLLAVATLQSDEDGFGILSPLACIEVFVFSDVQAVC